MSIRKTGFWRGPLRGVYILAVAASVIPHGSVHGPVIAFSGLVFASLALVAAVLPLRAELRTAMLTATGFLGLLGVWILLQMSPILGVDPAWAEASVALGGLPGALSVAPSAGVWGLPNLLVPALAFLTGIVLFQDDEAQTLLTWTLAILALGGALIGIYEFAISPGQLLFQPRIYNMDAVTAYFVNRNTAATFLGLGAVLWCALLFKALGKLGFAGLRLMILETDPRQSRKALGLVGLTLCTVAVIAALFLTKSRAGISASLAGIFVVFLVMFNAQKSRSGTRMRWVPLAASVAFVGALVGLYGSQFLDRVSSTDGSADPRWCFFADMWSAIKERPLTGWGYATIEASYPAYRNPQCMSLDLALDRGHNGYLEWAMGMGLPGLALLLIGALYLAATFGKGVSSRRRMRFVPAASLGGVTLVTIHSVFDFSLQLMGVAVFTASLFAAGVAASHPARSSQHHRASFGGLHR